MRSSKTPSQSALMTSSSNSVLVPDLADLIAFGSRRTFEASVAATRLRISAAALNCARTLAGAVFCAADAADVGLCVKECGNSVR